MHAYAAQFYAGELRIISFEDTEMVMKTHAGRAK